LIFPSLHPDEEEEEDDEDEDFVGSTFIEE
jgi:hypothetical protein